MKKDYRRSSYEFIQSQTLQILNINKILTQSKMEPKKKKSKPQIPLSYSCLISLDGYYYHGPFDFIYSSSEQVY